MDVDQQERIARNETRFRDMNEGVKDGVDRFLDGAGGVAKLSMLCECAVSECHEMVEISPEEYEHVRSNPRWFLVMPEHVIHAVETVVDTNERFWLIQKSKVGARVAEETDPRS